MAKWAHADVYDDGFNEAKNNADVLHLVSDYSAGDSYATVTTNSLGNATVADTDFTIAVYDTLGRKITLGAKSGTATATDASPTDLHLVVVDSVNSKVLLATDETSDQAITSGNPINFPSVAWKIASYT